MAVKSTTLVSIAALLLSSCAIVEQPVSSAVTQAKVDYTYADNGYLSVGFMRWYNPSFRMCSAHPYIVAEVESVSPPEEMRPLGKFCSVDLKVIEVIGGFHTDITDLKGIRTSVPDYISVTGGTRIVTSFVTYENANAIPHYGGTNCGLGHRLDRNKNRELTAAALRFLEMLRHTATKEPDTEDLRIWADIDPRGTAELLIRQIEMPDLYKKTKPNNSMQATPNGAPDG